jgi:hypothetical protein
MRVFITCEPGELFVCECVVVINIQEPEGELCLTPSHLFHIFTDTLHSTSSV